MTLDPRPMKQQLFDEMTVELKKYNDENAERLLHPIKHVNLTFEQLVEAMEDIVTIEIRKLFLFWMILKNIV